MGQHKYCGRTWIDAFLMRTDRNVSMQSIHRINSAALVRDWDTAHTCDLEQSRTWAFGRYNLRIPSTDPSIGVFFIPGADPQCYNA